MSEIVKGFASVLAEKFGGLEWETRGPRRQDGDHEMYVAEGDGYTITVFRDNGGWSYSITKEVAVGSSFETSCEAIEAAAAKTNFI
jgi:hypothetical protein